MPTGLSVLCFIRPDSRNLIIWFRSPEQNRHRQTEKSNKTTEPTILLTRSQYIWRDLCTSVIQYYSLGTCSYSDGEGEKGPDQHSWASEMVLNVPDPSVVYFFYQLPSDTTWYHHSFSTDVGWSWSLLYHLYLAEYPAYRPHEMLRVLPFRT